MIKLLSSSILFTVFVFASSSPLQVTFHKDVLPILQKNCQGCHRPGEAAPMSFLTYKDVRPAAKAIRQAVLTHKMPPWFADPHYGKFSNDRSLSQSGIDTLVRWADTGAVEGNPKDAPKPVEFVEGWNIGKPDVVLTMPKPYEVPETGTIDYTYYVLPLNFTEDRWIQMAEVRPGNRSVVHHVIAYIRPPNSKWMRDAQPGEAFLPPASTGADGRVHREQFSGQWLTAYAPGAVPEIINPGQARLIKAGSDIVLQMHYTAQGKKQTDVTEVGLVFAKETPREQIMTLAAANDRFVIPAGAPNHEVKASITLYQETKLVSIFPHMHLRGKAFEYVATYPTGETEVLLKVPAYDFSWQLAYAPVGEKVLPKGTKISCTAWFDNSPNNKHGIDPTQEVRFGEQSWEEMMIGFFDVAVSPATKISDLTRPPKPASD